MVLDNTAKISDIITSLQNVQGINQKADLKSVLVSKGVSVLDSDDMATLVSKVNGITNVNIKTLQRGTTTIVANSSSINVPISTVDNNKAIVILNYSGGSFSDGKLVRGLVSTPTNLQLTRGGAQGYDVIVEWVVVEFNNVKSVQKGSVSGGVGEITASFSSVNLLKSMLFVTYSTTYSQSGTFEIRPRITSTTSLSVYSTLSQLTVNWQVIEFN